MYIYICNLFISTLLQFTSFIVFKVYQQQQNPKHLVHLSMGFRPRSHLEVHQQPPVIVFLGIFKMSVLRKSPRKGRNISHSRFKKRNVQLKPSAFHRGNINLQWRRPQRAADLAKSQSLLTIQTRKTLCG